jgi:hypothetical protein
MRRYWKRCRLDWRRCPTLRASADKQPNMFSAHSRPGWGATHFLMKRLPNVRTEMSLHVLAYNLKRAMQIFGVVPLMEAIRA